MDCIWCCLVAVVLVGFPPCVNGQNETLRDVLHGPVCYVCDVMYSTNACDHTEQCGRDEMCMLHELMTMSGTGKRYKASCERDIICKSLSLQGKRSYVYCHYCCAQDKCNNHCGGNVTQPTTQQLPTFPTTTTQSTTTTPITTTTTKPATTEITTSTTFKTPTPRTTSTPTSSTTSTRIPARPTLQLPLSQYYMGCFRDNGQRILPLLSSESVYMTLEMCIHECGQAHYDYAGVEYRLQCFCSKSEPDAGLKLSESSCNHPCAGDSNQICGGDWAISVYKTDYYISHVQTTSTGTSSSTTPNRGLVCYQCNSMSDPQLCNHVVRCQPDEGCILYQSSEHTASGTRLYHSGCSKLSICSAFSHLPNSSFNDASLCHSCCYNDKCNNRCNTHAQITHADTTAHVPTTTHLPTTTHDVFTATTAPYVILTNYYISHVQTTSTGTSSPTTPNRGLVCYQCNSMSDPQLCNHVVRCQSDEGCILYQSSEHTASGTRLYHSGCSKLSICSAFSHIPSSSFNDGSYCHFCCYIDKCNNRCNTHAQITHADTTAHVPTTTHPPTTTHDAFTATTAPYVILTRPQTTTSSAGSLVCFQCHDIADPSLCHHVVKCSPDEVCLLYESSTQTASGTKVYRSGCVATTICNAFNSVSVNTNTGMEPCRSCCYSDMCNNKCMQNQHITHPPTSTQAPTTTDTHTTTRAPTSTETPITTRAPTSTETPTTTRAPTTTETPTTTRAPTTTESPTTTRAPTTTETPTTTRVSTSTTTHMPTSTKVPTTTQAPTTTHAPTSQATTVDPIVMRDECERAGYSFLPYVNLCFKLYTAHMSHGNADYHCRREGGGLAVIDTPGKYDVLQSILKYEPHVASHIIYIGGVRTTNGFYWPTGQHVTSSFFRLDFSHPEHDCLALDGTIGFSAKFVDCKIMYMFICTKDTYSK